MTTLKERADEFKRRMKDKTIKEVFKIMKREGLTLEDLSNYVPEPTLREKVLAKREVQKQRDKQRATLKKARLAKKEKNNV